MPLAGKPNGIYDKGYCNTDPISGEQTNEKRLETTVGCNPTKTQDEQFKGPHHKDGDLVASGKLLGQWGGEATM